MNQPPLPQLFDESSEKKQGPVECLGLTFENDEARRAYFSERLREKLHDPEFRKIEGFPIGEDEDILRLSDPPYYTACPNPFLAEVLAVWQTEREATRAKLGLPEQAEAREPFAADVSEGKNDPIYNAHSYHTKVPHKAIMRYILHYTEPGDVVFDGFCGTGMTGVAANLCGNKTTLQELGYLTDLDGKIYETNADLKNSTPISKMGSRFSILNDLSPFATFISKNYLNLIDLNEFYEEAIQLVQIAKEKFSWIYEFLDGYIANGVWSDVFVCPNCGNEIIYWDVSTSKDDVQKSFSCPKCKVIVGKSAVKVSGAIKLERAFETQYDALLQQTVRLPKLVLVEVTLMKGGKRHKLSMNPPSLMEVSSPCNEVSSGDIPQCQFFPGRQTNKLINGSGISFVAHMYTRRSLLVYGYLWKQELSTKEKTDLFRFCLSSINNYISRKQGYFGGGGGISGTLFTPSIHLERNVFDVLLRKIRNICQLKMLDKTEYCIQTQSVSNLVYLPNNSVDYIFTDPPFGESLQYSELNLLSEAWIKVRTNGSLDCVLNYVHKKDLAFYTRIMTSAFSEYHRILKPGKWITVEFHNSQNAVWTAIQQSLEKSGFIVADVRILDKQQKSYNAVNRSGAVDCDLVISAYKPTEFLEENFRLNPGSEDIVWGFIQQHLRNLPTVVEKNGEIEQIAERMNYVLFDRMVAYHVRHSVIVPITAVEFYSGLEERYPQRDKMFFLPEQVEEYDRARLQAHQVQQLQFFVSDESSAILWLRQQLETQPQTYSDLFPKFIREISAWGKYEKALELSEILEQNFLAYDGTGAIPYQIWLWMQRDEEKRETIKGQIRETPSGSLSALAKGRWFVPDSNNAQQLEKVREKALLKEFEGYKFFPGKRLKVFRVEAVRAGFKKAWQERDYKTIIAVAEKISEDALQEDPKLLMWYDQALTRMEQ